VEVNRRMELESFSVDPKDSHHGRDAILKKAFSYREGLLAFAYAGLRDWSLAEDVVQDAFLVIMDKWQDFEEGTSCFSWACKIVQYKTMEACRKKSKNAKHVEVQFCEHLGEAVSRLYSEEYELEAMRMRQALGECMKKLSAESIDILYEYCDGSLSCEDMARSRNRSVNAIRLIVSRVKKQLRYCVDFRLRELA
jgi:RNA polymerase sigma-70 factor, ECF subfamily